MGYSPHCKVSASPLSSRATPLPRERAPSAPETDGDALARAYAACEKLAREHYENFPVASRILPKALRPHVAAVYAFARQADDFADEAAYEGADRVALLDAWRGKLRRCADGEADDPTFLALGHTIREKGLPPQLFEDLLTAFTMDVTVTSYESFEDLLGYCRHSANPVGRLVLLIHGHRDDEMHRLSDSICTALQLTNFWQDVAVDLDKGRCYIPREDLRSFGVDDAALSERRITPALARLLAFQTDRTRKLFDHGAGLVSRLRGRLRAEIRLVLAGGRRILDKIDAAGGDVFDHRPTLGFADWGRLVLSLAKRSGGGAR